MIKLTYEAKMGDRVPAHLGMWRYNGYNNTWSCVLIPFNVPARVLWLLYVWLKSPFAHSPREFFTRNDRIVEVTDKTKADAVGDVIQMNANSEHEDFRGCVMTVDKVHSGGVRCYVLVPAEGRIYLRVNHGDYTLVGTGARVIE